MKHQHSRQAFLSCLLLTAIACSVHAQSGKDTTLMALDTPSATFPPLPARPAHKTTHASTGMPLAKATRDSLIRDIRTIFHRINTDTTLRVVSLDPEAFEEAVGGSPDNGGDATGYFKKDTLVKFVLSVGPSFGLKDYEYYYDQGRIVFIYEKDQHFPVLKDGSGLDHEKLVVGFEGRFYFNKGKLIAKLLDRRDQFMAQEVNDAYIDELLDVETFTKVLKKQLPTHHR